MSIRTAVIQKIKKKWDVVCSHLTEKASRLWAASEALSLEKFGITDVAKATGISRTTIYQGLEEIKNGTDPSYIRKKGAGRKRIAKKNSKIYKDLECFLDSAAY